ncbi:MAG: type VI secretion system protein TssA, partial [Pseudomonadota bacterium]
PEYPEVVSQAEALLTRTKDIRIAVILANASLRTEGIAGFEAVLRYIRGCMEHYWDNCHPQLDEDDDNDPTERANAVLSLTDADTILRSLRLAPLTQSRAFGGFSLRDIMVADGEASASSDMDTVPDANTVSAAFQDTDDDLIEATKAATSAAAEHLKVISDVFDEQAPGLGPDLTPIQKIVRDIGKKLAAYAGGDAPEEDLLEDGEDAEGGVPAPVRAMGGGGAINNPNDVITMLDRIVEYYARNEPSSPVPILLKRARRLVSADFVTIMRDMAPRGIENVAIIGGIDEEEL